MAHWWIPKNIIGWPGKRSLDQEGISLTRAQFLSSFGQRNDAILRAWLGEDVSLELIRKIGDAKEARYRELVRTQWAIASSGSSGMGGTFASGRLASSHCFVRSPAQCRSSSGRAAFSKVVPGINGCRGCAGRQARPSGFSCGSIPPQFRSGKSVLSSKMLGQVSKEPGGQACGVSESARTHRRSGPTSLR